MAPLLEFEDIDKPRRSEYQPIPNTNQVKIECMRTILKPLLSVSLFLFIMVILGTLFYFLVKYEQQDKNCILMEDYITLCCDYGFDYTEGHPRCIESSTSISEETPEYIVIIMD